MLFVAIPSISELWPILLIVVVLFGAKKLPELARAMGSSVNQFKKGLSEEGERVRLALHLAQALAQARDDQLAGEVDAVVGGRLEPRQADELHDQGEAQEDRGEERQEDRDDADVESLPPPDGGRRILPAGRGFPSREIDLLPSIFLAHPFPSPARDRIAGRGPPRTPGVHGPPPGPYCCLFGTSGPILNAVNREGHAFPGNATGGRHRAASPAARPAAHQAL